ncbi:hypothetical protein PCANC_08526 [Puccinia coronata f. sp. avenae]|uniref:Uncharacterized protein n=1 Tax=Puccinia coronata f. sp. avenae TaxID=200324 RepID=A0A2N5V957_9BASI|nr:hypothetical protein PCANC_08526 [Puccinia coronata f. sp. avenae]
MGRPAHRPQHPDLPRQPAGYFWGGSVYDSSSPNLPQDPVEGFVMSIVLEWWVLLVSLLSDEFPTPSSSPSSYA